MSVLQRKALKYNISAIVLATISAITYIVITSLAGSTVIIDLSRIESVHQATVSIDGQIILARNEKDKTITVHDQKGKKNIVLKAAGYLDQTIAINASWRGTQKIVFTPTKISASEQAARLDTGANMQNTKITDAAYFDTTWLAFHLTDADPEVHPTTIISFFDNRKGEWVVLNFGHENELEPSDKYNIPQKIYEEFF